ncbi:MAG: pantoate--beta-alanine ligase [Candidatus Latescibacteria bacterium]|nr:pantoate--beta-alanine ligase [Candidatus Latescibacterota bacterium]NIM21037.1 pantoate--beta-alanine ligase [Candidatus Latescibacterota bacterium]NIM65172.1 pantoate--beta-alanine ligase [Candidatus Latescibacterota bacterium]NIO01687.1 pantoate--beta-alanine ligase [Candidatus Latescibacterota bacterium]NIO28204.1 pantoate--beta-alanine ligase [Candidatus Latescibacterota bacterium]
MMMAECIASVRKMLAEKRLEGKTISLVPTMGALHDGHRSCMEIAGNEGDILVVSIYINPKQFGPSEDLSRYPRMLEKDLEFCERMGCDVVFVPDDEEMYPASQDAWVTVERFAEPLCGRTRPGHFRGVATVVAKLFNIVDPDVAVFGQKDAQQAVVIREMVRQLNFRVRLVLSSIVREPDGLAVSSRNAYLNPEERKQAGGLYDSLLAGRALLEGGERDPKSVTGAVRDRMIEHGIRDVEYAELLRADDLSILERAEGKVILALAARLDTTRLIDNLVLELLADGSVRETLLF